MNTGLRVRGKRAQRIANSFRQSTRGLALQDRTAGDCGDPESLGRLKHAHVFIADFLVLKEERFRHGQIEWQLNETQMMIVAARFPGYFQHPFERMIFRRVRLSSKTIPGCHTVILDPSVRDAQFQELKRGVKTSPELVLRNRRQLRFRIVHVVDIHTRKIQVAQRLVQLVLEITRRHTVRPASDVGPTCNAGVYEIFFDILPHVARWRAVEREVAALGADNDFCARKSAAG